MLIKMRTILAGPRYCARPGENLEVDDSTAKALLAGGYAVPSPRQETAAVASKAPVPDVIPEPPQAVPAPTPPVAEAATEASPSLADLGIDGRDAELLLAAGIYTAADIEAYGDLTKIKGIGPKTAEEIAELIAHHG